MIKLNDFGRNLIENLINRNGTVSEYVYKDIENQLKAQLSKDQEIKERDSYPVDVSIFHVVSMSKDSIQDYDLQDVYWDLDDGVFTIWLPAKCVDVVPDKKEDGWTPMSKVKPTKDGCYLVKNFMGQIRSMRWNGGKWTHPEFLPGYWRDLI